MEKAGLLDIAIAPLHWLERSRGWKRRGLFLLYGTIALTVGILGWREMSLWRLPNIREPFDEARLGTVNLAEADNAMTVYREAGARLKPADNGISRAAPKGWIVTDLATVDPAIRRWLEDNRAALEIWLRATDRPDALLIQPKDLKIDTALGPVESNCQFALLAMLEGARLEQSGDLEGAWRYCRGILRSSRHVGRHGGATQRLIGSSILTLSRTRVQAWTEDPRVTAALLRRAIGDVEACASMTSPASEMVRAEYFARRAALAHPEEWRQFNVEGSDGDAAWYNHVSAFRAARYFLLREPERSRRVLRLIAAGLLAQCDRPPSLRPTLTSENYMVYNVDSGTPPAVKSLTPDELSAWADRSGFATIGFGINAALTGVDSEPAIFDSFRVRMAERAYEIERGRPPKTYGDLVGPYLKALPEGFEPGESASATP